MNKLTEIYTIRFSVQQAKSLEKLKEYDVNISRFIRQAIKEKISRDWKMIKEEMEATKTTKTKWISIPEVGKGATVTQGKDKQAYEVMWVSDTMNIAIIQRYRPVRMSYTGEQKYIFKELEGCPISIISRNGEWRILLGSRVLDKINITFGVLNEYYHE